MYKKVKASYNYKKWYGQKHLAPHLIKSSIYSIAEFVKEKINQSLSFTILIFLHKINSNINYRLINKCLNLMIILTTRLNNVIINKK